ncbi:hypothetical protein T484DRAFT_1574091, partial [Baffinella frigidus]
CGVGSYKAGYGNVDCDLCPPGEHSSADGDVCIPCPLGTYKDVMGNHICTSCDEGMTTMTYGTTQDECVCAAVHFINEILDCEACPVNTYNPVDLATGRDSCLPCTFRFFQPSTGRAECV